jgi:hypothetical protein
VPADLDLHWLTCDKMHIIIWSEGMVRPIWKWEITAIAFCVDLSQKRRYIGTALSVRLSIRHENLALAITLPFLNIFKLYCLWQHARDNVKFFRSRSHLMELCPFFFPWILTRKLDIGYNFAISQYFLMKLLNCIAYDNMLVLRPNSLGQGHIWWSYVPFYTCIFIPT